MRCHFMMQRRCAMLFLIVFVIAMSSADSFGQLLRRNNNAPIVRPVARPSLKAEMILESNSSLPTHPEWRHVSTQGGRPPIRRMIETPTMPGAPTIVSWDFGVMSASPVARVTRFRFTFTDLEDSVNYWNDLTFHPGEGKIRFRYNTSIGADWDLDEEASTNLAPTKKLISDPEGLPGSFTEEEWTLGGILDGKTEGTAVFRFEFRGNEYTEVKIKLQK